MELLCVLNSHYVLNVLYYAHNRAIPAWVGTDRTDVSIRYIVADLTVFYVVANVCYGISKPFHLFHGLAK